MEYKILEAYSRPSLQCDVQQHLNDGWTLVGGVSTMLTASVNTMYTQALYKVS